MFSINNLTLSRDLKIHNLSRLLHVAIRQRRVWLSPFLSHMVEAIEAKGVGVETGAHNERHMRSAHVIFFFLLCCIDDASTCTYPSRRPFLQIYLVASLIVALGRDNICEFYAKLSNNFVWLTM